MNKTYLISDTHFNHDKIKTYCDRPANFTELIIRNWQNIVQEDDLVIHVGDVFIGKAEGWKEIYPALPGRKVLVRGNHDGKSPTWYMTHGFDFACDALIYRGAYITHKPSSFLPEGTSVNIHGHLHNVWDGFLPDDPERQQDEFVVAAQLGRLVHPWQRLLAVEYTDYRPVEFDKFIAKPDKYQAHGPRKTSSWQAKTHYNQMGLHTVVVESPEHYKELTGKEYSSAGTVNFVYGGPVPEDQADGKF